MRFIREKGESHKYSSSLIAAARETLSMYTSHGECKHNRMDHDLATIASVCLNGEEGKSAAIGVCHRLAEAISDNLIYAFDHPGLLSNLARAQPLVFLDAFLGSDGIEDNYRRRMFSGDVEWRNNPINEISDDDLIRWCVLDPVNRCPLIASSIQAFSESEETGLVAWKPFVNSLFEKAPDLGAVFERLAENIRPTVNSGSRADILQKRSVLFQSLFQHDNAEISAWAKRQYAILQGEIKYHRDWEDRLSRMRNESFE